MLIRRRPLRNIVEPAGLALCLLILAMPGQSREKVMEGYVCSQRVHRLTTEIPWHLSLADAKARAEKEKKLIFWVNMLGKIEDDT